MVKKSKKKVSSKKPLKKPLEKEEAKAPVRKLQKDEYHLENVPTDKVRVIPGFNPRKALGSLASLKASVREFGIEQPLVVRPSSAKAGMYDLIVGNRRYAVAVELGLKSLPVVIRHDLGDDNVALAFAVAENSEDSRTALTPLEQGAAYQKMMKADKALTPKLVGKRCGCSDQHVRRMVRLLDVPKAVQERLESGEIKAAAAAAVAEMTPKLQTAVMDRIVPGMTEAQVRKLGNEIAKDKNIEATVSRTSTKSGMSSSKLTVVRTRGEMRAMADTLVCEVLDTEDEGKNAKHLRYALAAVYYYLGQVEQIDIESKDFKSAFTADEKRTAKVEEVVPSPKKSSSSKKTSKKKVSKKKG